MLALCGVTDCAKDVAEEHFVANMEDVAQGNPDTILMWNIADFDPQFTPPGFGYSVYDMILCGRAAHIAYLPGPEDRAAVEEVIERFGIEQLRDKPVGELSGDEKQMVLIARAIAQKTPVVLMDEPTPYLDIRNQVKILNVIREINRSDGVTFAIALHDPNHALSLADRVVLVSGGSAVLEETETAMTVENMDRLYSVKTAFTVGELRLAAREPCEIEGVGQRLVKRLRFRLGADETAELIQYRVRPPFRSFSRKDRSLSSPRRPSRARRNSGPCRSRHRARTRPVATSYLGFLSIHRR